MRVQFTEHLGNGAVTFGFRTEIPSLCKGFVALEKALT
jgi:hypothetical protein